MKNFVIAVLIILVLATSVALHRGQDRFIELSKQKTVVVTKYEDNCEEPDCEECIEELYEQDWIDYNTAQQ